MEKLPLRFLIKNGFLHIFSASVINKILQFCSSILLIRFLPKEEYGQYSYAGNILGLFLLVEGLGVCSGLLQYASENIKDERKLSYVKLSFKYGISFDVLLAFSVFVFTLFFKLPIDGSSKILRWMFLIPLLTLFFNIIETYLRASLKNLQYSILSVMNTILVLIFSIIGVLLYNVWGVIIGRYIAYIITDIVAFFIIKRDFSLMKSITLPEINERKTFLKYSIVCMLSNSISGLLYLIDTFFVGLIVKDSSIVATYKTATLIPFAINFIPASVMTFAYPYFAKINNDKQAFKKYYNTLLFYMGILNAFISAFLIILAPLIIKIIFGNNYSDALVPFRILSLGYFFAGTFRILSGNLIAAIKKVKINFYSAIISGLANILLDIVFILWWGATGAAISTVCIFILDGTISTLYMYYFLYKKHEVVNNNK